MYASAVATAPTIPTGPPVFNRTVHANAGGGRSDATGRAERVASVSSGVALGVTGSKLAAVDDGSALKPGDVWVPTQPAAIRTEAAPRATARTLRLVPIFMTRERPSRRHVTEPRAYSA